MDGEQPAHAIDSLLVSSAFADSALEQRREVSRSMMV